MSEIRPIFWSQLDSCVKQYPLSNKPLQQISKVYPVYFVCSGTEGFGYIDELREVYPRATFLVCSNNNDVQKARQMFDILKYNREYDILVRTCCDSVIMDVELLLEILQKSIDGKHAIIGNAIYRRDKIFYIRGGCNAVSRSVVEQTLLPDIKIEGRPKDRFMSHDIVLSKAIKQARASFIEYDLFCLGLPVVPGVPVCHPVKRATRCRYPDFLKIVDFAINSYARC